MTVSVKKKDCICIINYINLFSASLKQNKCCLHFSIPLSLQCKF